MKIVNTLSNGPETAIFDFLENDPCLYCLRRLRNSTRSVAENVRNENNLSTFDCVTFTLRMESII